MKIIDRTTSSPCAFGDLPALAIFKSNGNLYMKLPHTLFTNPDEDAGEVNAIFLNAGEAEYFSSGETIYRVEASLTVTHASTPFSSC